MAIFKNKQLIKSLAADLAVAQMALETAERERGAWRRAAEAAKTDLDMWRAKYELSQLNPEVKADTEGAFKRGAQFAKQQALNNVAFLLQNIQVEEPVEETNA
jgi:hypothetical protein